MLALVDPVKARRVDSALTNLINTLPNQDNDFDGGEVDLKCHGYHRATIVHTGFGDGEYEVFATEVDFGKDGGKRTMAIEVEFDPDITLMQRHAEEPGPVLDDDGIPDTPWNRAVQRLHDLERFEEFHELMQRHHKEEAEFLTQVTGIPNILE